ncbi:hypothetical protein AXX17_AT5G56560 [Arabidopsis thaliana]|jgi:hypothetical protein|uniref:Uncharacterized protein n=1 Tax=Arabidopsis thaliana TaxID=3702 RepID=A0A178URG6_ARATH|nr:hypothetical protein AXX17_AT5G56560 [Arabidopsis thaliana]
MFEESNRYILGMRERDSDSTAAKTAVQGYDYDRNCLDPRLSKTNSLEERWRRKRNKITCECDGGYCAVRRGDELVSPFC